MKKIINKIKNNKLIYVVLGILIGLAITAGGVYAATVINAKDVAFSGSTSGLTSTNMQSALNEAYNNCKTKCPEGYICEKLIYYYAFGTPNTNNTTDFTTLGKNVFARLGSDDSHGVCINDGGLFCIQANDYDNTVAALKAHFGESSCAYDEPYFNCNSGDFSCYAYSDGTVICYDSGTYNCRARADGSFDCW